MTPRRAAPLRLTAAQDSEYRRWLAAQFFQLRSYVGPGNRWDGYEQVRRIAHSLVPSDALPRGSASIVLPPGPHLSEHQRHWWGEMQGPLDRLVSYLERC